MACHPYYTLAGAQELGRATLYAEMIEDPLTRISSNPQWWEGRGRLALEKRRT